MAGIVAKWGPEVAERGFAQIPTYLLVFNQLSEEKLTPIELLVLIQLIGAWWEKDKLPFPSLKTLSGRVGASQRQVQRAVNRLEELGLLERVKRRTSGIIASNSYNLEPLVNALNEIAELYPVKKTRSEKLAAIGKRAEERLALHQAKLDLEKALDRAPAVKPKPVLRKPKSILPK